MHMGTTSTPVPPSGRRTVHPHAHGDNGCRPDLERQRAVHPHAHGDNCGQRCVVTMPVGSPPCTWGQRQRTLRSNCQLRFTPMHMGTTRLRSGGAHAFTVHPHAHGDNGNCSKAASSGDGSPPCTWGQHPHRRHSAGCSRFTPMHMGTTRSGPSRRRPQTGSPPCTWGQRPPGRRRSPGNAVHPHAHGDNAHVERVGRLQLRFTPMHMGTTRLQIPVGQQYGGSPPCTWGQHLRALPPDVCHAVHPMHMGTTSISRLILVIVSVHPHAHGDNPSWSRA